MSAKGRYNFKLVSIELLRRISFCWNFGLSVREARQINNQPKTLRGMLNLVRYVDSVNDRRMILKMHHTIKRDCRIFRIRKRIEFAGPKRVTSIKISLQRIFIVKIIKSLL